MATTKVSTATPKDFFLWLGALIALYASITSLLALLFQYINYTYPDALSDYFDPLGGAVRASMATLLVLAPIAVVLFSQVARSIAEDRGKAGIWVRNWALVLTIFIAASVALIDLITLITTFLGGEITVRFALKALSVLVVSFGALLYFTADIKGYWIAHPMRARAVGLSFGVLAVATVVAGFFIIGTPAEMRERRFDQQRVWDLQSIQWQAVSTWQTSGTLPESLAAMNDPLSGFVAPVDPRTGENYEYLPTGATSFTLCATFEGDSPELKGRGETSTRPAYGAPTDESFEHSVGRTCFERIIDPLRYPPLEKDRDLMH